MYEKKIRRLVGIAFIVSAITILLYIKTTNNMTEMWPNIITSIFEVFVIGILLRASDLRKVKSDHKLRKDAVLASLIIPYVRFRFPSADSVSLDNLNYVEYLSFFEMTLRNSSKDANLEYLYVMETLEIQVPGMLASCATIGPKHSWALSQTLSTLSTVIEELKTQKSLTGVLQTRQLTFVPLHQQPIASYAELYTRNLKAFIEMEIE